MPSLTHPELEAAILADLDDPRPYLVYGDWLSEHGDPRGELIAVQTELARARTPELVEKEQRLLEQHEATWLGALAELGEVDFACTWRHGFLASVRLGPPTNQYEKSERDFAAMWATIAALPGTSFIREVVVGAKDSKDGDWQPSWQDVIDAMATHGLPAALETLTFDRGGLWDISTTRLGDLSPLYPRLGGLRTLTIQMGSLTLGAIDLPRLRSFEVITGGLTSDNIASIANARWPELERLSICIGATDNDYGCDVTIDHLAPILAGQGLARVRHLGLANAGFSDELARVLPRSKILEQLTSLDLSRGTFGDVGAQAMLDHADAYRHLQSIDLSESYIRAPMLEQLRRLGPTMILDRQGNPGDDDEDRYVSISE